MVPGFNTDFKYRGETYHVQTEDNGVANPVVVTLLYHKGAILASRRTPYHELVGKSGFEQELMQLMKGQHKDLMRALLAGAYDKNGSAPAVAGSTGTHPADAASAVAGTAAKTAAGQSVSPVPVPAPRAIPVASRAPVQTTAGRPTAPPLDEAIRRYLKEFAATAGAAVH